jgi:hypothetical protein
MTWIEFLEAQADFVLLVAPEDAHTTTRCGERADAEARLAAAERDWQETLEGARKRADDVVARLEAAGTT